MLLLAQIRLPGSVLEWVMAGITFITFVILMAYLLAYTLRKVLGSKQEARDEFAPKTPAASDPSFAAASMQAVIKRLKDQEKELERLHRAEKERAQQTERLSEAEALRSRILADRERFRIFDTDRGPWAPTSERGRLAKEEVKKLLREREEAVIHVLPALEKMGTDSGDAPWLTLDAARQKGVLPEFSKEVGGTPGGKSPRAMAELVRRFDLGEEVERAWTADPELHDGFEKAVEKFPTGDAEGEQARKEVLEAVRERPELGTQILPLLKSMAADDAAAPWLTVAAAVKNDAVATLTERVKAGSTAKTPAAMAKIVKEAGLDDAVTERWLKQAPR